MKGFKGSAVTSRLPKHSDLKISQDDLRAGTIYSGPYEGYSDDELEEVLDEEYLYKEHKKQRDYTVLYRDRDDSNFRGKLIHYQQLDEKLNLPPGTSKTLLKRVALRYGLIPESEWENSIRFEEAEE
jgi:hypothetical protein